MSWAIGYDERWQRDVGYGVPAYCDHPKCHQEIDRGLSYVCGSEPYGGDHGCGLYFCGSHLGYYSDNRSQACHKCGTYRGSTYKPKPDHPRWMEHKLTDESWAQWRAEHPEETQELARAVPAVAASVDEGKAPQFAPQSSSSSVPIVKAAGETR